jgi:Dehydrogenases with different specificities (related to short-chain alcohol dehydrogenases)
MSLSNKTVLITGGSRGIGKAIALKLASAGANIVIAAKTSDPHPKLEGTIHSAVKDIQSLGGKALAVQCNIRFEDQIQEAVNKAISTFGGIDILVNNASAIQLYPTELIEPKKYDLMQQINVRGTFFMSQACIPWLKKSDHAHILNLSPPLNLDPKWFGQHLAYTISKYGMSMIVLGLAEELKSHSIAVNALWPKTIIATAAIKNLPGGDHLLTISRKPDIVADAAHAILKQDPASCTGHFYIDEEVLKEEGIKDFTPYSVVPGGTLAPDIFI